MEYISYIDMVQEIEQESFKSINPFIITIENIKYHVIKVFHDNIYIAESANNYFFLEIITNTDNNLFITESELKNAEKINEIILGIKKTIHIVDGCIYIKYDIQRGISLENYIKYKTDPRIPCSIKTQTEICVDVVIKGIQIMINNIAAIERNNLVCPRISLDNIYIEITSSPVHPIFSKDGYGIELKIDIIGKHKEKGENPLRELAICLYSVLKNEKFASLDYYFTDLAHQQTIINNYPLAICQMIQVLSEPNITAQEILFSPIVST